MESRISDIRDIESRIAEFLSRMSLEEKIGQLCLVHYSETYTTQEFRNQLVEGRVGAILNQVDKKTVDELQEIATTDSRLGIPLLIGRDVIHGFATIFPIPLGLAATWNPKLVEETARIAALEASLAGVNWTFAPMLDIARDPRWGRIAESLGEDPHLTSVLGAAMVRGFQGEDLSQPGCIAACAKHFAGYGASESGRDYNSTNVAPNELRNVHLPPFKAAIEAKVASIMASFGDLDGIPASANEYLLRGILRQEWGFDGFVVSDWDSIGQLRVHGLTADDRESACRGANAGVDMEMSGNTYSGHLKSLVEDGSVSMSRIDDMVSSILRIKFRLGLFDSTQPKQAPPAISISAHLDVAREAALESVVLLTNRDRVLPLDPHKLKRIAVLGPLADDGYEQLGTWIFDGKPELSQTPLQALRAHVGNSVEVQYCRAMESSRSTSCAQFAEAIELAERSDVAVLFLGEESLLTGEAHCRSDISLPGNQEELICEIAATGTPVVLVVMTGRPLALETVVDRVDALLCAWHPGNMAGPALIDLIFGKASPSGKLPVTFPRVTGQIPIYYAHKNTGRPPTPESVIHIDDIEVGAPQHSFGNTSFHLDVNHTPLFPFGFGLSYAEFTYADIQISSKQVRHGESFTIAAVLTNTGSVAATEVAQLYVRDLVGSLTRPVRELKRFERFRLQPGESTVVTFQLSTDDLAFYGRDQRLVAEPGTFHAWIGGSSTADLQISFELLDEQ